MRCGACGGTNTEGANFCSNCGAPLATATAPAREERKVVTVLFCDLVGSTAQAEQLDPEDVRALLTRYHEHVRTELERFGGTVEKFIGDAVMAVFGAPTAHEDDPERAVRAALAIRDWARDAGEVEVRIAVNTGEALVTLAARPELGQAMVAGDIVNTAARLQSAAPENGVLVGETTYRATREGIDYRDLAPVEAKGKSGPLAVWEALQARARVQVERMGRTPLVGRDRELTAMRAALERARDEQAPQLVTLVGVPGIGKSRLVFELFRLLEGGSGLVSWRQGRSLPYGEGVSYWALAEMVKAETGILETDGEARAAERLAAAVGRLVSEETDARWMESHLRPLVGLDGDRDRLSDQRAEAFAAWRRFLEALAERRPLVLVFEDLHFADDGLLDFVDYLAEWAASVPLLIVGTARPELLERRPGWGGGKVNALTLALSPLSEEETAELVHALLERPVLPAGVQRQLLERAEGNPLYAEEFARLVEEGLEPEQLPESVQGIIAARLDGLSADEKAVLHDAAVFGRVFWLGGLEQVGSAARWTLEERLHRLERKEFVRRERRSSVAGEAEYSFKHLLVRDVAYGQVPRAERAERHRLAAQWISSLGRADDHAELVANHYLAALELARAAGRETASLVEPARLALRDAGDRALALRAHPSAVRFYEAALQLWEDAADLPELLFSFGRALAAAGDERADGALRRSRDALVAAGARGRAAEVETHLSRFWWYRGQRDRAREHVVLARQLVDGEAPSFSKALVLAQASRDLALAGEPAAAVTLAEDALALAEALALDDVRTHAMNTIGMSRSSVGDFGGVRALEESLRLAQELRAPELIATSANNLAACLAAWGYAARGLEVRAIAVDAAERFGLSHLVRFQQAALIDWDHALGNWDDLSRKASDFMAERGRHGPSYMDALVFSAQAVRAAASGDDEEAAACTEHALETARAAGDPQLLRPVLGQAAFVEHALGKLASARTHAAESLSLQSAYTHGGQRPEAFLSLMATELGVEAELRAVVEGAPPEDRWIPPLRALLDGDEVASAELFAEMGLRPLEAHARRRAAMRLVAQGRGRDADEQLRKALAFWESVGAFRYIREGEGLLAETA